jgi:flagellar M-ring protein FliF
MEQVRYNNAMEQELAKTIAQIAGIRSARVHLAAPKQSVFVRDRVPTKASVIITRAPGKQVSSANVQAIILIDGTDFPDVLAHVSVRARNLKVMFTVCFDEKVI